MSHSRHFHSKKDIGNYTELDYGIRSVEQLAPSIVRSQLEILSFYVVKIIQAMLEIFKIDGKMKGFTLVKKNKG